MKTRTFIIIAILTFSTLGVFSCSDESENILPEPVYSGEGTSTVGEEPVEDDID